MGDLKCKLQIIRYYALILVVLVIGVSFIPASNEDQKIQSFQEADLAFLGELILSQETTEDQQDTLEVTICDIETRESLIAAKLYSKIQQKCFQANIDGIIRFPLMEHDLIQFEYGGYNLLVLTEKELVSLDTVFMSASEDVQLGSIGVKPFMEADRYRTRCKCCSSGND